MPDEKIVETPVADLEIGMYVAELDRPWSSSGFLVQGFYIQSPEDLEALRAQCEYVFIDVFRTRKGIERRNDRHFAQHPSVARSEPLRPGQQPRESASPFRQRPADVPAQPPQLPPSSLSPHWRPFSCNKSWALSRGPCPR